MISTSGWEMERALVLPNRNNGFGELAVVVVEANLGWVSGPVQYVVWRVIDEQVRHGKWETVSSVIEMIASVTI